MSPEEHDGGSNRAIHYTYLGLHKRPKENGRAQMRIMRRKIGTVDG